MSLTFPKNILSLTSARSPAVFRGHRRRASLENLFSPASKAQILSQVTAHDPKTLAQTLLVGYHGSVAYGLAPEMVLPANVHDIDLVGIYVAPREHYLGWQKFAPRSFAGFRIEGIPFDIQFVEIRHFFLQCLKSSPTWLPWLWQNPARFLKQDGLGAELVQNRGLFFSKQIYSSFSGFVHNQLRETLDAKTHNRAFCRILRILRLGTEVLSRGGMILDRSKVDRDELLAILRGEIPEAEVRERITQAETQFKNAFFHSELPEFPQNEAAQELLISLMERKWSQH